MKTITINGKKYYETKCADGRVVRVPVPAILTLPKGVTIVRSA